MTTVFDTSIGSKSHIDHRKAVLSLRWLLIILASYLTLFTYVGTDQFSAVFAIAVAFSLSNVGLMLIPRRNFIAKRVQRSTTILDVVFVSAVLYLLRTPETHLELAFLGIFLLAALWRDLRLVLFSIFVVSLLFGV